MTPKLEFCLLGPLVVRCGGVVLPVPRGRQRAVLAVLLLNAGRVVSVGEIGRDALGARAAAVSLGDRTELREEAASCTGGRRPGPDRHPVPRVCDPG